MSTHDAADFLEIYHTDSTVEAGRILEVVLVPHGIQGVVHDRVDHVLPAPATQPGEVSIAVPASQRQEALKLLREARDDGVLDTGRIVE